jgi:hypothetical protein
MYSLYSLIVVRGFKHKCCKWLKMVDSIGLELTERRALLYSGILCRLGILKRMMKL